MNIAFGSDHAGYDDPEPFYKPALTDYVESLGHTVIDCGTNSAEAVDYPDVAEAVCAEVLAGSADVGILLCGTGIGMSMKANRHPEIRAAVCTSTDMAQLSREHNDANVLCIGRRVSSLNECKDMIATWLVTPFSGVDRHRRRVEKMC